MQLPPSLISSWKYQALKVNLPRFSASCLPSFLVLTNLAPCFWESPPVVAFAFSTLDSNSTRKAYHKFKNNLLR